MFSERAFFSFVSLADSSAEAHRAYNEWHQLDHRPENLLLPGVAWGDRWARTAACAELGTSSDPSLAGVDYVAMYWFREPYQDSYDAWQKLAEDSFQWGRGPTLPGVSRPLLGFFNPVLGYVAPRVRVSAEALVFRPNRGLHLSLTQVNDPHGYETHEQYRWQDTTRIPDLLTVPGVAGAWTFSYREPQRHADLPLTGQHGELRPGSLRIRLLYLDGEPEEVTQEITEREKQWDADGRGAPFPEAERTLWSYPVRTIVPWQDW